MQRNARFGILIVFQGDLWQNGQPWRTPKMHCSCYKAWNRLKILFFGLKSSETGPFMLIKYIYVLKRVQGYQMLSRKAEVVLKNGQNSPKSSIWCIINLTQNSNNMYLKIIKSASVLEEKVVFLNKCRSKSRFRTIVHHLG